MLMLSEFMQRFYSRILINNVKKIRNRTFLITGASGLIGSNLVSFLNYINIKNSLNLKIIAIIRSNPEPWFEKDKNILYIKKDLSREKLDKNLKFDFLIHCATYAQPKKFTERPKETVLLNIKTLFDLLELAKNNKAVVLYLSSAEIYGEPDKKHIPTDETYYGFVNTLSNRAIYAESKRLAESICYAFQKEIAIKIVRVLLTYGPGLKYDDQRVISEFIKKAQNEKIIRMMDSGNSLRTFCFISDLIEMIFNVILNSRDNVYNLCGKETFKIKELAEIIAKLNGAEIKTNNQNKSIFGTPKKSVLSNKKYLDEFKKDFFVDIKEGLNATSNWFKNIKYD